MESPFILHKAFPYLYPPRRPTLHHYIAMISTSSPSKPIKQNLPHQPTWRPKAQPKAIGPGPIVFLQPNSDWTMGWSNQNKNKSMRTLQNRRSKLQSFLAMEEQVESTMKSVAMAVDQAAEVAEEMAVDLASKLPEGSKLKEAACFVECVAKEAEKDEELTLALREREPHSGSPKLKTAVLELPPAPAVIHRRQIINRVNIAPIESREAKSRCLYGGRGWDKPVVCFQRLAAIVDLGRQKMRSLHRLLSRPAGTGSLGNARKT